MSEPDEPRYAYHLFVGHNYWPAGGLSDYIGSFISEEMARYNIRKKHDWWEIARSQDGSLALVSVASSCDEEKTDAASS